MGQPAWRKLARESQKEKAKEARPLNLYAEVTQELEFYCVNASALELFSIRGETRRPMQSRLITGIRRKIL